MNRLKGTLRMESYRRTGKNGSISVKNLCDEENSG
jgi:hypothetical protein